MCRIAGILNKHSLNISKEIIDMRDCMAHGGPDGTGVFQDTDSGLALGHRRLSIIDLSSAGNQPMSDEDNNLVIVFNGEIYNYRELKVQLEKEGVVFRTHTDTEVIIKAYQHWGRDAFNMFRGMFAFALYDKQNGEIILVRDPQGIKPLYYSLRDNALYFASEIKAFKALGHWHEREDWKVYFLTYGYLPEPITTLADVSPLPKGCCLSVKVQTLESKLFQYAKDTYSNTIKDADTAIAEVRKALSIAVERHMVSDAPIGLFLSGGIDSSLLTLLAKNTGHDDLHTLSIVFDDKNYSEDYYQNIVAKKINAHHKPYNLTKDIFIDALPDIFKAMDQPTSDGVNTYFICKFAKEYGLKAVLSGLGADELFGGYASFNREDVISKMNVIPAPLLKLAEHLPKDKYKKISFLSQKNAIGEYLFHRGFFSLYETAKILDADIKSVSETLAVVNVPAFVSDLDYGNKVSYLETNLYMQSQLLKDTDIMSMWHSVEVRVPYLDIDLVNLLNSIDPAIKFNHKQSKFLLVESYKDLLPEEIWNRKKQGFVFPFQKWMNGNEKNHLQATNDNLNTRYRNGKLNWSRYWTYLVANNFAI